LTMMARFHARGKPGLDQLIQRTACLAPACLKAVSSSRPCPARAPDGQGAANMIGTARWLIDADVGVHCCLAPGRRSRAAGNVSLDRRGARAMALNAGAGGLVKVA
jgi:hypothetical protein